MIIRSFKIDRFGIFAGQDAVELSPGLNIFVGDNEAGKSTLLNFFRAMFFGYQRNRQNVLDYMGANSRAAISGGSLALEAGDGTLFNLVRRPGKHGGELALGDENGRFLPEVFFTALLGGCTDKMYDQVFCFGHNDLSSLAGMKDEQVAGALHAAAFGTGFKSPLDVVKQLEASQKKIFTARAYSTPVHVNFKKLADAQAELARLGSELGRYNSLKAEREELAREQEVLKNSVLSVSLALARQHSLLAAWADRSALAEQRAALAINPHPGGEFGIESIERFDEMLATLDVQRAERKKKAALLQSGREALARGESFALLAGIWPDCQNLLARKNSVQSALGNMPRLEAAINEGREGMEALARGLGAEWSLERAVNFDISMALQEGIELGRQNIETAARMHEQAAAEAARLEADARETRELALSVRHSFGQGAERGGGQDAGHNENVCPADEDSGITLALYSAEARARLESCGQALAAANREAAAVRERISILEQEKAVASADLEKDRAILEEARRQESAASDAAKSAQKPPFFSLSTARQDTRRVLPMILCLVAAGGCFSSTYKYFTNTYFRQSSLEKFSTAFAWKDYLAEDWQMLALGLFFVWAAFYWMSPRVATLGRWRPKPAARIPSYAELAARSRADALAGRVAAHEAQLARIQSVMESSAFTVGEAFGAEKRAAGAWNSQAALYGIGDDCPVDAALRIFDVTLQAAQTEKKACAARDAVAAAARRLEDARESWKDWLQGQNLATDLTPESVRLILQRVNDIKRQAESLAGREAELAGAKQEVESFRAELRELCRRTEFQPQSEVLLGSFDELYKAAYSANEESLGLKARARELENIEADLLSLDDVISSGEARLAALMAQGQASGEADYRLRFKQQAAHMELRREEERLLARLDQAAAQMHAASGTPLWDNTEDFLRALGESGRESLAESTEALKAELASIEDKLAEKQQRQGHNQSELERLESGRGSAEFQAEEAALKEDIKTLARRWGILAMAQNFIGQARRVFEEERHGSVIKEAGDLLAALTGRRYQKMLFDMDGKGLKAFAINSSGESMDSESSLSQGTKEQLYLALRLAFIKRHNLAKESLPLVMDDIMVNFDPGRARYAAELFVAFSAANQTLFFTCHPHTASLLRSLSGNAKCFGVKSGNIGALD